MAPVAFGLALVENAYDETARVEAVRPAEFEKREEALLALARQWLAAGKMSLLEIAFELGFSSQSHFGAVFRRVVGASPGDQ